MTFAVKLTIGVIVAVTAILIGYDIWAVTNDVSNRLDTISGRIRIWAFESPIIPWTWGVLAGHFFGPSLFHGLLSAKVAAGLLIFASWVLLLLGICLKSRGIIIPPWCTLVIAVVVGAILWPQGHQQ